jgi:hypothetical protein
LLAGVAGVVLAAEVQAGDPPAATTPLAVKARLEAARRGLEQFEQGSAGSTDYGLVRVWARRVMEAELVLCACPAERKAALEAYVRRARNVERVVRAGHKAKAVALGEVLEAEFFRADAEALLVEELDRQPRGG